MEPLIDATEFQCNDTKIYSNVEGSVTSSYEKKLLVDQVDSPVKWMQIIDDSVTSGVVRYVEVGPGKVLTGLARRMVSKEAVIINSTDMVQTISDLSGK